MSFGEGDPSDDEEREPTFTAAERKARREKDLREVVLPRIAKTFEKNPALRSALFLVSQYWNDNANDEVHGLIQFSYSEVPRWPHDCAFRRTPGAMEDFCTRCERRGGTGDYFSLPYESESFRAWEAYCFEYGNQDTDYSLGYLPYALIQKSESNEYSIDVIAPPLRPWLDAPDEQFDDSLMELAPPNPQFAQVLAEPLNLDARQVLGDALIERGDPYGEYLNAALAGSREAQVMFEENHRRWLGPLARVIPSGGCTFANGFLDTAAVYFPEDRDLAWIANAEEWSTVRELRFLPRSKQHLGAPMMRALRSVGPLEAELLLDLVAPHLEHVQLARSATRTALLVMQESTFAQNVPSLRTLTFTEQLYPDELPELTKCPVWKQLTAVHIGWSYDVDAPSPLNEQILTTWLQTELPMPFERGFGTIDEPGVPMGMWAYFVALPTAPNRFRVRLTVPRPGCFGLAEMTRALATLVRSSVADVVLIPSRWFEPTAADIEAVTNELGCGCRIEIAR